MKMWVHSSYEVTPGLTKLANLQGTSWLISTAVTSLQGPLPTLAMPMQKIRLSQARAKNLVLLLI